MELFQNNSKDIQQMKHMTQDRAGTDLIEVV